MFCEHGRDFWAWAQLPLHFKQERLGFLEALHILLVSAQIPHGRDQIWIARVKLSLSKSVNLIEYAKGFVILARSAICVR
jgi:hypothetical protein